MDATQVDEVVELFERCEEVARATSLRVNKLVSRVERALACEDHDAIKHGSRDAFDAATTSIGSTEPPRSMPLGNCRRCGSTLAWVGA